MSQREQFVKTTKRLMEERDDVALILGDISVFAFKECFDRFPDRCFNVGICEQSMISLAAGLSQQGFYPIVHTIAPFLVERAFEQIKIDFGYQIRRGLFVSVGASYDYAALGCTHHCPGDFELMRSIPGMRIYMPWDEIDVDWVIKEAAAGVEPAYVRLSEDEGTLMAGGMLGRKHLQTTGKDVVVVSVGTMLPRVLCAVGLMKGVGVLHYSKVAPFDSRPLKEHFERTPRNIRRILLVEPYYRGGLTSEILEALYPSPVVMLSLGVRRVFSTLYGTRYDHENQDGLTEHNIRRCVNELLES